MTHEEHLSLTLWLAREVGRLHAANAALVAVMEELRVVDSRLDTIKASQIQRDAWQTFYEKLEELNPGVAARLDELTNRPPLGD